MANLGAVVALTVAAVIPGSAQETVKENRFPFYKVTPVPFTAVKLADPFWAARQRVVKDVSLEWITARCDPAGGLKRYRAKPDAYGPVTRLLFGLESMKAVEGIGDTLALFGDPGLAGYAHLWVQYMERGQDPSGYLSFLHGGTPIEQRWRHLRGSHELYGVGHFLEGAIAMKEGGNDDLMYRLARKTIDLVDGYFGPDRVHDVPGHPEIELALMRLYGLTGETRWLDLARFFVEGRGHYSGRESYGEYAQDHLPVREQRMAVGHAVRGGFLWGGTTDLVGATGDEGLRTAVEAIWRELVEEQLYITGGAGVQKNNNEGYGKPFDLPPDGAYAETCATVANVQWAQRLHRLKPEGAYYDVIERMLYNSFYSSLSLAGDTYDYCTRLQAELPRPRSPWHFCPCCPPNIVKMAMTVGGYYYGTSADGVYVNLYGANTATVCLNGEGVQIVQETDYPWDGRVALRISHASETAFALHLRHPAWAENCRVRVNGKAVHAQEQSGYFVIKRAWKAGDEVLLDLPMVPRRVYMAAAFDGDYRGRVALQRGPLVYAFEAVDNLGQVRNILLPADAPLKTKVAKSPIVYTEIRARGRALHVDGSWRSQTLRAIPYAYWNNRTPGEMRVWIAEDQSRVEPPRPTAVALSSSMDSSGRWSDEDFEMLRDGRVPVGGDDPACPHYVWPLLVEDYLVRDTPPARRWIYYRFPVPTEITATSLYWYQGLAEEKVQSALPLALRFEWLDGQDVWHPAVVREPLTPEGGRLCRYTFATPVMACGLRLSVEAAVPATAGLYEWSVE